MFDQRQRYLSFNYQPRRLKMIEFTEKNFNTRTIYTLVADQMPVGLYAGDYQYTIDHLHSTGGCYCKSRSFGAGSTRYYSFRTLDQALAHATKWAKRKQAEGRKERAEQEALKSRMEALTAA